MSPWNFSELPFVTSTDAIMHHVADYRKKLAAPRSERRTFWISVFVLGAIAAAVSIRRLMVLAGAAAAPGGAGLAALDAFFTAKAALTRAHIVPGMAFVLLIPAQLSARVRAGYPRAHRWLGRIWIIAGILVGVTAYGMAAVPIGGRLEMSATVTYTSAFLATLLLAWRRMERRDTERQREWTLRAIAIALGIATTRPVMGIFFATAALTGLSPAQFFGMAFWIGFTSTAMAGEWYISSTRQHGVGPRRQAAIATTV